MSKDNVLNYQNPAKELVEDHLTDFLRLSAQKMLQVAIEQEVQDFISQHSDKTQSNGHRQIVRNGYLPERNIQTGIGNISVSVPRTRDRGNEGIKFTSNFIPSYMRRTVTIDVLLPLLYLKGISTKDFSSAFEPILGHKPNNMSPQVISKLKSSWYEDYKNWQKRDLSGKEYVYIWADGVYLRARMEEEKSCILVIIGADSCGNKEIIAIDDGFRESKESWCGLLSDLKSRGLTKSPNLAIGDGALGFWGALTEQYPKCKHQRCWVHKTSNILNKLPKSSQKKAKQKIQDIYMASTKEEAQLAFSDFIDEYEIKYPKATQCLKKDQEALLTFYSFPAEHWMHIRTTNPIESAFATVKHRTIKSKNCFSRNTIIAAVFKLMMESQKRWAKLRGKNKIAEVIRLDKFIDGINKNELIKKQQIDRFKTSLPNSIHKI